MSNSFVYILTNKNNQVFYIGVTTNLNRRCLEHQEKKNPKSFSAQNNVNKLVYYEEFNSWYLAIKREKQLKNWHREWKINLIKEFNPNFEDLFGSSRL